MSLGFKICQRKRAASARQADAFRPLPVANISDCMHRMNAGGAAIQLINKDPSTVMSGPALTVRTRPGDNLMVHKALSMISVGDVLVVDAGGDLTNAIIGEIMVTAAISKGLGGLVVHGAIRDSHALSTGTLPVFACGITHRGPYKDGPGEINVPISLGGMLIEPGDLIVGDADGIVSVPLDSLDEIYSAASAKSLKEAESLRKAATAEREVSWVDVRLAERGYPSAGPVAT